MITSGWISCDNILSLSKDPHKLACCFCQDLSENERFCQPLEEVDGHLPFYIARVDKRVVADNAGLGHPLAASRSEQAWWSFILTPHKFAASSISQKSFIAANHSLPFSQAAIAAVKPRC